MIEYFTPVIDSDVPEAHQSTAVKYRQLAAEYGVPVTMPVCYRVKAGFTLKGHAAEAGPCHDGFKYLQDWNFPDVPTSDGLMFWVPHILGGTFKTKYSQLNLLSDLRTRLALPNHHLTGFGQVGWLSGLILAHLKATGLMLPPAPFWARTGTCDAGGYHFRLGSIDGTSLYCDFWGDAGAALGNLGVFAMGVEELDG